MRKAIRMHIFQQMTNYRKPSSFLIKESFPLPPYSTIIGMIHSACGFTEYHPMKISIQGTNASELSDFQTLYSFGIPYDATRHQIKVPTLSGKDDGVTRGPKQVMLLTDVELYIHIYPENEDEFDEILEGLRNPAEYISIGRREDIARVDEVTEVYLEKTDSEDEEDIISTYHAYLPVEYIGDATNEQISGTVYNLPKRFEIDPKKGFRKWAEVIKARHLPPEKLIIESVMDNDEVFFDRECKLPVFFA